MQFAIGKILLNLFFTAKFFRCNGHERSEWWTCKDISRQSGARESEWWTTGGKQQQQQQHQFVWASSLKFEHYVDLSGLPSSTTVTLLPKFLPYRGSVLGQSIAFEICGNDTSLRVTSGGEGGPAEECQDLDQVSCCFGALPAFGVLILCV